MRQVTLIMNRGFNVDSILGSVGWTGATMVGSHLLWLRVVVRTAINGLRALAIDAVAKNGARDRADT
jgi:hypothetical protein